MNATMQLVPCPAVVTPFLLLFVLGSQVLLLLPGLVQGWSLFPVVVPPHPATRGSPTTTTGNTITTTRHDFLTQHASAAILLLAAVVLPPAQVAHAAKLCTDLESCREIGERKDAERLARNPIVKLTGDNNGGLQYKVLTTGLGDAVVTPQSTVRIVYSISQGNGSYMYSRGMGFNKINISSSSSGQQTTVSDLGLDSLSVTMGSTAIPVGIQRAIVGAKRGERRRIECPAKLGFETSDWEPKPTTFRGQRQVIDYQNTLTGRGGGLPFPASTIWDVEVTSIR